MPRLPSASTADGTFGWTYAIDNNAAQYLAANQTVSETYTVTISDGQSVAAASGHVLIRSPNVSATVTSPATTPGVYFPGAGAAISGSSERPHLGGGLIGFAAGVGRWPSRTAV